MKKVLSIIALFFIVAINTGYSSLLNEPKNSEVKKVVLKNYKDLFNTGISCSVKKISNLEIIKKGKYNEQEVYWPFIIKAKIQNSCNSMGGFAGGPSLFGADDVSVEVLKLKIRLYKDDYDSYMVRRVNLEYANEESSPKERIIGKWVISGTNQLVFDLKSDGTTANPKNRRRNGVGINRRKQSFYISLWSS